MPKANLYNLTGQSTGQVDLPENLFGLKPRSHHLWRSVTTHLSNQRLGTVKTKGKGEVSGGGKKPFKQKERVMHAKGLSVPFSLWVAVLPMDPSPVITHWNCQKNASTSFGGIAFG
jgi:hypothetical protein